MDSLNGKQHNVESFTVEILNKNSKKGIVSREYRSAKVKIKRFHKSCHDLCCITTPLIKSIQFVGRLIIFSFLQEPGTFPNSVKLSVHKMLIKYPHVHINNSSQKCEKIQVRSIDLIWKYLDGQAIMDYVSVGSSLSKMVYQKTILKKFEKLMRKPYKFTKKEAM